MRRILAIFIVLCMFSLKAISAIGEWIGLLPAVDALNLHLRVMARSGAVFGIDVASCDTTIWKRYAIEVPSIWPDELNNSMGIKVIHMTHQSGTYTRDYVKNATIFVDGPKSVDISMKISGPAENALLEVGSQTLIYADPVEICDTVPIFVRFFIDKNAQPLRETIEYEQKAAIDNAPFESLDELLCYLKDTNDPNEALWAFYDRTTSPLRAAPNGEYVLATIKNGDGYDLIYIKDNEQIPSPWKILTVKARLHGCDMPGVFDVDWIDRRQTKLNSRVSGVIDGDILTFNFPYWKVALRFNRVNLKKLEL